MQKNNENKKNIGAFKQLPEEILLMVLAYLPPDSILQMILTAKFLELFIVNNKQVSPPRIDNSNLLTHIDNFIKEFPHKTNGSEYSANVRILTTVLEDFIKLATSKQQDIKLINKTSECIENINTDKILDYLSSLKFYVNVLTFGIRKPKTINNKNKNPKVDKLLLSSDPSPSGEISKDKRCIAAFPNGNQLLITKDNKLFVHDVIFNKEPKELELKFDKIIQNIDFFPDSPLCAIQSNGLEIQIWNLEELSLKHAITIKKNDYKEVVSIKNFAILNKEYIVIFFSLFSARGHTFDHKEELQIYDITTGCKVHTIAIERSKFDLDPAHYGFGAVLVGQNGNIMFSYRLQPSSFIKKRHLIIEIPDLLNDTCFKKFEINSDGINNPNPNASEKSIISNNHLIFFSGKTIEILNLASNAPSAPIKIQHRVLIYNICATPSGDGFIILDEDNNIYNLSFDDLHRLSENDTQGYNKMLNEFTIERKLKKKENGMLPMKSNAIWDATVDPLQKLNQLSFKACEVSHPSPILVFAV